MNDVEVSFLRVFMTSTTKNDDKELSPGKADSRVTFFREIEKCDLLCANCHRIVHYV